MKKFNVLCLLSCSVFSLFSQPKTTKSPVKAKPPKLVEKVEDVSQVMEGLMESNFNFVAEPDVVVYEKESFVDEKAYALDLRLPEFGHTHVYDNEVHEKVSSLSVRELVGQMTQIDLALICEGDICALKSPQTLNADKLKTAFETYAVGSVLNVGCGSGTISRNLWIDIQKDIQQANFDNTKHKIPVIFGIDAIHGANYTKGATLFPQQIGQAAMWNPDLIQKAAQITAYDVRASGIHWNFSPVLDLGRQPLWSRFFETYGEDVMLAEACTRAAILGYQDNQPEFRVAACMKHFLGYSYPLSGKDRTPAWIDDRNLREYYLPTFQEAIRSGALTTMINSGELNGIAVHTNYDILTKLLREELGFNGIAVTDWEDIYKLHHTHKVAPTLKEAVFMSISAGIDMSMTPSDFKFNDLLIELVEEGRISILRLQQSVYRILKVKKALGLWNKPVFDNNKKLLYPPFAISQFDKSYPLLGSSEHSQVALEAALESITLLKNQQTLPIEEGTKIRVAGNAANDLTLLNGAWSHTWQGGDKNAYQTPNKSTFFEGISQEFGTNQVSLGLPKRIKKDEVLVYCIGEKPATEIPGDISDLKFEIPEKDLHFLQQRKRKGAKTILVLALARPRIITQIDTLCTAVIHTYLPGDEGGKALAQILSGRVIPSGKLPFTYPRSSGDIVHYDRKPTEDNDTKFGKNAYNPLYDFGHGLSYTQFEYSDLKVVYDANEEHIGVTVTVTNKGNVTAKEVIQVYYRDEYATITPSVKRLCAFEKVEIEAGKSHTYTFTWIPLKKLSFINKRGERVIEEGDFTIMVKGLNQKIYLKNGRRFSMKD